MTSGDPGGATEHTTPRLLLRGWRDADLAPFAALNADREVMANLPRPLDQATSDGMAARLRADVDRRGWGLWALEVVADPAAPDDEERFCGFVGLAEVPPHVPAGPPGHPDGEAGDREAGDRGPEDGEPLEVGWRLARWAWGRGYATEAGRAALTVAAALGRPVVSFTAATNVRSIAVMERLGLRHVRDFDHEALPVGHPLRPHVLLRLP